MQTPGEKLIDEWKTKWRNVYFLEIYDQEKEFNYPFYFREITKREYNELLLMQYGQAEMEEEICRICVLYPKFDFSDPYERAGIAKTLADHIIYESHLMENQAEELLNRYRQEMMLFDYQAECIIHEAFQNIPLEEIRNWTIEKTMYYLSRAEYVLRELRGIPLQYIDTNEQAEAQQYQHHFVNPKYQEKQKESVAHQEEKQAKEKKPPKEGMLSEEELMRMLAEEENKHGRTINPHYNTTDEVFPELSWFKAEEELLGDFD